jgi:hypothetical protein
MEILINLLKSFQFNSFHIVITAIVFFIAGFVRARLKTRKMAADISMLEKNILDLNAELLFGKTEAPVIRIQQTQEKSKAMTR